MARGGGKRRTYARDNRGRFASTGATARGGRLKTAAGNKRKTVTARMAPAKAAGTIGKRKGLKARPAQPPSKPRVSARGKVKNTNSEQQTPKALGKMKPLKGVGSVVARNLQGFKGMPVQIRSRKEASKAYRQRTNQTGKTAAGRRLDSDLRRVVTARSTVQQGSVFGGVKRVSSGPMRPIGERASDGSIRRSRRSKPAPIVGSKSWRKGAERMMKTGQMDPWVQAQYNRRYGKR